MLALPAALVALGPRLGVRVEPTAPAVRDEGAGANEPTLRGTGERPLPEVGSRESPPARESTEPPRYHVAVVDDAGRPLAGARVRVRRPSFSMFQGGLVTEAEVVTDARGIAAIPRRGRNLQIPPLDAEPDTEARRFEVSVLPPRDRPDLAPLDGVAWPPAPDALRLPSGDVLAGVVVDPSGRGLAHVQVVVDARPNPNDRTDENGTFRIPHLLPGEHAVRLRVPGLPGVTRRVVATGAPDTRLVVDAGASLRVRIPDWSRRGDGHRLRLAPVGDVSASPSGPREVEIDAWVTTVYGLDANETYTLHLPGGPAGRIGWAPRVGGWTGSVDVPLREAVALEGPLAVPEAVREFRVRVEATLDGMVFPGSVRHEEGAGWRWRVEDLPSGEVEVVGWSGKREAPEARGSLLAAPEGERVLRLRRVR